MHGLAVLQHDVVRNIHQVINRAHAGVADPLPHPGRGGRDPDVPYHAGGVAAAERGLLHDHLRQVVNIPAGLGLHHRGVQLQLLIEGHGGFAGQADHAEAVGAVRRDLELHHVVVASDEGGYVVAGAAVLAEDEDPVLDAVRELLLLGVEVGELADMVLLRVIGHQVARVQVRAGGAGFGSGAAQVQAHAPAVRLRGEGGDRGGLHGAVHLVPGLDIRGDGGLRLVQGVVVPEDRGGTDLGVGVVMGREVQLLQGAEHALGLHAAQGAAADLGPGREQRAVQRHRHQVARVHVPGPRHDLHRGGLARVKLQHPHMVRVGVLLHREDLPHHHVLQVLRQVLRHFHLGAGDRHRLGEAPVVQVRHSSRHLLKTAPGISRRSRR